MAYNDLGTKGENLILFYRDCFAALKVLIANWIKLCKACAKNENTRVVVPDDT